jgi:hypothetical protein
MGAALTTAGGTLAAAAARNVLGGADHQADDESHNVARQDLDKIDQSEIVALCAASPPAMALRPFLGARVSSADSLRASTARDCIGALTLAQREFYRLAANAVSRGGAFGLNCSALSRRYQGECT